MAEAHRRISKTQEEVQKRRSFQGNDARLHCLHRRWFGFDDVASRYSNDNDSFCTCVHFEILGTYCHCFIYTVLRALYPCIQQAEKVPKKAV